MKKWMLWTAIVVMLLLSVFFMHLSGFITLKPISISADQFPPLQTLQLNRKGNELFKTQNYQGAFENYIQALEHQPFSSELHLNIGLTYELQGQAEKALTSYANAAKYATKPLIKFMALFNQAQLLGKAKKVDEALALYQEALKINPASKEVKTNIELLFSSNDQGKDGKDQNDKKDQKDNKDQKDKKDPKDDKNNKDGKDKKDPKDNKDGKDPKKDDKDGKDPKKDDPKKDQKDEPKKDPKDDPKKDPNEDQKKDKESPKTPQKSEKYKPRPFNGEKLSEADVKKILGEIKQQEQKIRSEFNRKDIKEQPRDKDW